MDIGHVMVGDIIAGWTPSLRVTRIDATEYGDYYVTGIRTDNQVNLEDEGIGFLLPNNAVVTVPLTTYWRQF